MFVPLPVFPCVFEFVLVIGVAVCIGVAFVSTDVLEFKIRTFKLVFVFIAPPHPSNDAAAKRPKPVDIILFIINVLSILSCFSSNVRLPNGCVQK